MDVEEWLDEWVEANLVGIDVTDMAALAIKCRGDADADDIDLADLLAAANGDLEKFLAEEQVSITEANAGSSTDRKD